MNLQKQVVVDCYHFSEPCVEIVAEKECDSCRDYVCLYVCPAGLFDVQNGEVVFNSSGICLECGACRLVCDNIRFRYPAGGQGVIHRFG